MKISPRPEAKPGTPVNTLASLLNLGGPNGLVVFLALLVFFGARRLPPLSKNGKAFRSGYYSALREFSKSKDEIRQELDAELRNLGYSETRIERHRSVQSRLRAFINRRLSVWLSPVPAFQPTF